MTIVDSLGGFLELTLRSYDAEDPSSITVKRDPELFLPLPAKSQDDEYISLSLETNAEKRMDVRNQLSKQRRVL